jgi:outer membrane protein assembly factor BamB
MSHFVALWLLGISGAPLCVSHDVLPSRGPEHIVDPQHHTIFAMQWHRSLIRRGFDRQVAETRSTPVVSENHQLVVVAQGEGKIAGLSWEDGRVLWSQSYVAPLGGTLTLIPGTGHQRDRVLVPAQNGRLLLIDAQNGSVLWERQLEAQVMSAGTVVDTSIFVLDLHNHLYRLDIESGKIVWRGGRSPTHKLSIAGSARPVYHAGAIYAGFSDGYVEAYRLADGSKMWSRPLSVGDGPFTDVDTTPVVSNGTLFAASYGDGLYALGLFDGRVQWHLPVQGVTEIALVQGNEGILVAASSEGRILGIDRDKGKVLYTTRFEASVVSGLKVRNHLAVMGAGKYGLVVFDARSGKPLQTTAVAGRLDHGLDWRSTHLATLSTEGDLYTFILGGQGLID